MKNIVRFLAPFAFTLVPSACSLIADADRSKITDDDSGEGGSGDSPSTGGTSGKGGSGGKGGTSGSTATGGSTTTGGSAGTGGGAGASGTGGEPESGGMGGVPDVDGMGGEPGVGGTGGDTGGDAGSGGAPDTAGMGGEAGMGGGCGLDICGELCVDTSIDAAHCGACDRACSNVNTSALACASGQCTPTCAAGFADCTTDDGERATDDGCETNLNDVATCGTSCGNRVQCADGEFCVEGVCEAQCEAPNTECSEACVNLEDRIDHCGECDRDCSTANTTGVACAAGECDPTCGSGFGDCNVDDGVGPDDGCETDIAGSVEHCNACNRACSTANASETDCNSGACAPTCSSGFGDCVVDTGSGPDDGCETDLDGSVAHCNACNRACSTANASATDCSGGSCDPTCNAGFDDCNVDTGSGPDDGCETNTATSAANCNACGRPCSNANASATACSSGTCAPTCNIGFGDCVVDTGSGDDNGCETSTSDNTAHCNACNRACSLTNASVTACNSGSCDPTCNDDFADCNVDDGNGDDDGCETDLAEDIANCNACGRACSTANASATVCFAGECDPTCNLGFADCNLDDGTGNDDGCETDLSSVATCGFSCETMVACTGNQTCVAGLCVDIGVVR